MSGHCTGSVRRAGLCLEGRGALGGMPERGGYWRLEMRLGLVLGYANTAFGGESEPECFGGGGGLQAIPWQRGGMRASERKSEGWRLGTSIYPTLPHCLWVLREGGCHQG